MPRTSFRSARFPGFLRLTALFGAFVLALGLAVTVVPTSDVPAAQAATTSGAVVSSIDTTIGTNRLVEVALACKGTATCRGTVTLSAKGVKAPSATYGIRAGATKTMSITLRSSQYTSLVKGGTATATVTVKPSAPSGSAKKTAKATLRPATAATAVTATAITIQEGDTTLPVSVRCASTKACSGTLAVSVAGKSTPIAKYALAAKQTKAVAVRLTAAQRASLSAEGSTHSLTVSEAAPNVLSHEHTVAVTVAGDPGDPEPTDPPSTEPPTTEPPVDQPQSDAYANRNWTPTAYDTCSAELHRSYSVTGPDGKLYPTWHPAQVIDPATGELCTFGHEHGADPASSDIFEWVADFYSDGTGTAGLPFGYASEELDAHSTHSGLAMRHEDNAGHKVFVRNNVTLVSADHQIVTYTTDAGEQAPVVCDYLIKAHQGSHSADATSNNAHEMLYAVRCTDGTELISTTLSRFGMPNQFSESCSPGTVVQTVGSTLPAGDGGVRLIPDRACIQSGVLSNAAGKKSDIWAIYEVWQSDNSLKASDGTVIASFDPWFGVRNPSRYYNPGTSSSTVNGFARTLDAAWETPYAAIGWPWSTVMNEEPFDYRDPRSPFDGAQRDFYLNQTDVTGWGDSAAFYTDPYGANATAEPLVGSIKQWAVAGSATGGVSLEQRQFDQAADYGKNNGVHAPN